MPRQFITSHNMSTCLTLLRMYASPEWRAKLLAQSGTIQQPAQSGELTMSQDQALTRYQPRVASLSKAQSGVKTAASPERRANKKLKPRSSAYSPEWQVASK